MAAEGGTVFSSGFWLHPEGLPFLQEMALHPCPYWLQYVDLVSFIKRERIHMVGMVMVRGGGRS